MSDPAQATGIDGAAQQIAAFLTPNGELQAPDRDPPAESPAEGTLEANPNGEETAEAKPEGEAEAAPEEEAAAPEEGADEAPPEKPVTLTVRVDGKSAELPVEEVVAGYQRHADYSRKTAEVAEERKLLAHEKQSVAQERQQYAQLIPALRQQLQSTLPAEPDPSLLQSDPERFFREERAFRDHHLRLQAAQIEENRVRALTEQQQAGAIKAQLAEAKSKMVEAVPHWKDQAKWEADRPKILNYGKKLGFTDEELSQARDPRAVVALFKAMRFDELMARQPKPVVNKGPQQARAGSAQTVPSPASQATKAKQRLAQTGRVDDAVAVLKGLL